MTRRKITSDPGTDGRTQQHFKDECDIQRIVNRFRETGQVTHLQPTQPQYGYVSSQGFSEAMFLVTETQQKFDQLPSKVRSHFNNQPAAFLEAASDPSRRDEFVELGLLE